jgi:hypothetical protein
MKSLMAALLLLTGCGYPAFTSAMRSNGFAQDAKVEGQCLKIDRRVDKDVEKVNALLAQGWRFSYASEYTSTARADFPSIYCVERVVGSQPAAPPAGMAPGAPVGPQAP